LNASQESHETILSEWLKEIVQGAELKRGHSVFIVSCREHDLWFIFKPFKHLKSRGSGHNDVKKE
jgi:hypothetical protein